MVPGAPDRASTSSIPAPPSSTSAVTTTVKAMVSRRWPGMPGSLTKGGGDPAAHGVMVAGVNDQNQPQTEAQPEGQPESHTEGQTGPQTEPHDPSVPEAYSSFMRQG